MDDNTIRLEGRFIGHAETPSLQVDCHSVTYDEPEYSTRTGADGSQMRSMIRLASLTVTGLPSDFRLTSKGEWTHIVSAFLPSAEAELREVEPMGINGARFVVK